MVDQKSGKGAPSVAFRVAYRPTVRDSRSIRVTPTPPCYPSWSYSQVVLWKAFDTPSPPPFCRLAVSSAQTSLGHRWSTAFAKRRKTWPKASSQLAFMTYGRCACLASSPRTKAKSARRQRPGDRRRSGPSPPHIRRLRSARTHVVLLLLLGVRCDPPGSARFSQLGQITSGMGAAPEYAALTIPRTEAQSSARVVGEGRRRRPMKTQVGQTVGAETIECHAIKAVPNGSTTRHASSSAQWAARRRVEGNSIRKRCAEFRKRLRTCSRTCQLAACCRTPSPAPTAPISPPCTTAARQIRSARATTAIRCVYPEDEGNVRRVQVGQELVPEVLVDHGDAAALAVGRVDVGIGGHSHERTRHVVDDAALDLAARVSATARPPPRAEPAAAGTTAGRRGSLRSQGRPGRTPRCS